MVEEDSTSPKEQMRGVRVRGFGVVQSGCLKLRLLATESL